MIIIDSNELALYNLKNEINCFSEIEFLLINLIEFKILEDVFLNNTIDYVFHAAAYKHVDIVRKKTSFHLFKIIFFPLTMY